MAAIEPYSFSMRHVPVRIVGQIAETDAHVVVDRAGNRDGHGDAQDGVGNHQG
jgi:hypothetical protein